MWCFVKWCYILFNTNQRTFIDMSVRYFSYKTWCHIKWNHWYNLSGESSSGKPMMGTWCLRGLIVPQNAFHPWVIGSNVGQDGCALKLLLFDSCSMTYMKKADSDQYLSGRCPFHKEHVAVVGINHPSCLESSEDLPAAWGTTRPVRTWFPEALTPHRGCYKLHYIISPC